MASADAVIVITSISAPNTALRMFAESCAARGHGFIVVGDTKSPAKFELPGCDYHGIERQLQSGFSYSEICPTRHYVRKNIGYLLAIRGGATVIRDTDDDNFPRTSFWEIPPRQQEVACAQEAGWANVYAWFSEAPLWPRGLPLDAIQCTPPAWDTLPRLQADCPIQQGLADENPDVDAIYRLVSSLPQNFRADRRVALGRGTWCPFNSQNTTWFRSAFPLLYLPATCTFRMTDIWRSFVAQRIAWENGWSVLFHEPTVWQERNEHDLMADFADEVPGYLHNRAICRELEALPLAPGAAAIAANLRACYQRLVEKNWLKPQELPLLEAWLADLAALQPNASPAA
jgi:hypothetical protein